MAGRYPQIELDIITAGSLVHDIGKTVEYSVEEFFATSTKGRLIGHLVIGVEILDSWIRQVKGFPEEVGWQLKHIILSHHGEYQFGSPVLPRTLEALVVHFADNLDAKINGVLRIHQRETEEPGDWTSYVRLMEREFFKSKLLPQERLSADAAKTKPSGEKLPGDVPVEEQSDIFDYYDENQNTDRYS